jgi:hypothetical protein
MAEKKTTQGQSDRRTQKRKCAFHREQGQRQECSEGQGDGDETLGCAMASNLRQLGDRAQAILNLANRAYESVLGSEDEAFPLSAMVDLIRSAARDLIEENLDPLEESLFPASEKQDAGPKAVAR